MSAKDVFKIHKEIMDDYKHFVESFIFIKNERIRNAVQDEMAKGKFWPDPLIQFNPSFEQSDTAKTLCDKGIFHEQMAGIFKDYQLYRHQVEALQKGCAEKEFIVTSGTGSGKSLAYLGSIFNFLLKKDNKKGVKAIIVYPMNALINSQTEEIKKYKQNYETTYGKEFPITFAQYTGQEKELERLRVKEDLPDLILTNYMMLELILTRSREDNIRNSIFENLRYLVFDELHTYRGRQGADVALLIRRIKAQSKSQISCIGTSATMTSGGSRDNQKKEVAQFASKLFGTSFSDDQIISEYLIRCFDGAQTPSNEKLKQAVSARIDELAGEDELKKSPLAIWLENKVALEEHDGHLARRKPLSFSGMVALLQQDTAFSREDCERQLLKLLKWIANVNSSLSNARYSYLPYKIHQFIAQTGAVYVSLHSGDEQIISLDPAAHKVINDQKIPLFPTVFSRYSGSEFVCVSKDYDKQLLRPREFREITDEDESTTAGYLILDNDAWNPDVDMEFLPESWIALDRQGNYKITKQYAHLFPKKIYYDSGGNFSDSTPMEYEAWFMPSKLLFDPTSGTCFDQRTSEGTKLSRLGSEGRSTSTTVLSFATLRHLSINGFAEADQKLLSFTDNRQDAALQAGHFTDFLRIAQLRSAIYRALNKDGQLDHSNLAQTIFDELSLQQEEYAANSAAFPTVLRDNENALKDYLMYLALYDLRRGWRVVLPNLEQCAMLVIDYKNLAENCSYEEGWKNVPLLNALPVDQRIELVYQVLDYFRKSYALASEEYLTPRALEEKTKAIKEKLKDPWKFGDSDRPNYAAHMRYETLKRGRSLLYTESIGLNSALGKHLKKEAKKIDLEFNTKAYIGFIKQFLDTLAGANWLTSKTATNANDEQTTIYQLRIDQILWKKGDGQSIKSDPVKHKAYKEASRKPNSFFQFIYKTDFKKIKRIIGREHTGQLTSEDRQEREIKFRSGEYSALFCSPTMELGIDIANLNVVHMRNAPPNPANYAQRSGRAGRSGQAALVFTSCSSYSPHDSHYFRNATDMVSGTVAPPKIDLLNQELLLTHLDAIYLSKANLHEVNQTLIDLISEQDVEMPLREAVCEKLKLSVAERNEVKSIFKFAIQDYADKLKAQPWFTEIWLDSNLESVVERFDRALDRWRKLYVLAQTQMTEAQEVINSGLYTRDSEEMKEALRKQSQAVRQRDLLQNEVKGLRDFSEFYPYRYLAAEGFLPGYNFTRLPIRTYIPIGDAGEYVSRPRFIALREFGPGNIVYHNGSKYRIEQLLATESEKRLEKAKISTNSGYIMMGSEFDYEVCPFNKAISLNDSGSKEILTDLIEMTTTRTVETEKILCEEEERVSQGYEISTFFSVPGGVETMKTAVVKNDEASFLNIRFIPTARLVQVNQKWRRRKEKGFLMGIKSGRWKRKPKPGDPEPLEENKQVMLFTQDTADALYIEPIKALALTADGVITLQYALKQAIENIFQIESNEISAVLMGDESAPNIFLFESSEGSLGILSQFIEDKSIFRRVIDEAYRICRFEDVDYKEYASYTDLLSYYNQRFHDVINRFTIKDALEKLQVCQIELLTNSSGMSYDEQYEHLLKGIDPNSSTERVFLDFLYKAGLRLPDRPQKQLDGIYCQPDFFYDPDIWIFCDGTPHDDASIRERDRKQREAIRNRGDQVITYYYKDKLHDLVSRRKDVFRKVR